MGSNTEYVYGARHGESYTSQSYKKEGVPDGPPETKVNWPSAIKIVGYPESGDINIGVVPLDQETGEIQEVSDLSQWTSLEREETARLIRALQTQAKRVFGQDPW
jgi:hypothetical protein